MQDAPQDTDVAAIASVPKTEVVGLKHFKRLMPLLAAP